MIGRFVRYVVSRSAEVLFAVGLVLGFFLVFMGLLSLSFPQGTSLGDLMRSGDFVDEARSQLGDRFDVGQTKRPGGVPFIASLTNVHRSVKDKPSNAIAWKNARAGMKLGQYHAVQTFERSRATITFTESSALTLNENSLIILKSTDSDPSSDTRRASLIVLDGELRGTIAITDGDRLSVEIEAATEAALIKTIASPGSPAEFTVRVNEDKTSTFSVLSGQAEITSKRGSMVIEMNQAVTVGESGDLGPVVTLPPSPSLQFPSDGTRRRIRSSRARLNFRWSSKTEVDASDAGGGKTTWIVSVARDRKFRDIVHRQVVEKPEATFGNFKSGIYHWRVRMRRGTLQGPASRTQSFRIVRDRVEPELAVEFPSGIVRANSVTLSGTVEPGTRVIVADQEAEVGESGEFSHLVPLERGANIIVVEAIDDAGNVAYRSHVINARY